jgi:two-component system NtrC family response regulator
MKWALIENHDVFLATDGEKAMELIESEHPPLVTLDLGLPPHPEDTSEGLKLLAQILRHDPSTKVIVVTGNPERAAALEAISLGAHDFFTKPIEIDELKAILKRAYYVYTLEAEYRALQRQVQQRSFGEIIGTSAEMEDIFSTIRKVATTEVPVLITGESGTGKELIARAIHNAGIRQEKPFVVINCGAIPENLMESELFGHEKGAFTGAHMRRKGRIELAEGGTLLLDEVGDLPLALQVKILRFLQNHTLEKVGGRESIAVDCRVIAATNRNIKKMVSDGHFREDLYFRLAVVSIEVPPLRKRDDDVLLLTNAFLQEFSTGRSLKSLSEEAIKAITSYEWPGNVRELQNKIRRAITLSEGSTITPVDLGLQAVKIRERSLNLRRAKEELEKRHITMAMLRYQHNISKAAEELGLARPTLHTFLKKYKIRH